MPNSRLLLVENSEKSSEHLTETAINELIKSRILLNVVWTDEEQDWRTDNEPRSRKLCTVFTEVIKNSATGCFLSNWNFGKEIDSCIGLKTLLDMETLEGRMNTWSEEEGSTIKYFLKKSQVHFSWNEYMNQLNTLVLNCLNIGEIDSTLQSFDNIQSLILSSNKFKNCDGSLLPRRLKYLELYNNYLSSTDYLGRDPPPNILYLGIGRNKFITGESLQSLVNYKNVQYLDLSDNDLVNLAECIKVLKELKTLHSLSLFGTPCSMATNYSQTVLKELPQLIIFDGVNLEIWVDPITTHNTTHKGTPEDKNRMNKKTIKGNKIKSSREKSPEQLNTETDKVMGELHVNCYRVFCIKRPKERKNMKNLYYIELESPLTDEGLKEHEKQKIFDEITKNNSYPEKNGSIYRTDMKTVESKESYFKKGRKSQNNMSKKIAALTIETKEPLNKPGPPSITKHVRNEKNPKKDKNDLQNNIDNDVEIEGCTKFRTNTIQWSDTMKFKQPIVINTDLLSLRDLFRSVLKLRLIHMKVKVSKEDKKLKIKNQEVVLFQEKLAVILIPLKMIKWNEHYLGYKWDSRNPWKAEIFPNVKDVKFQDTKLKNKKGSSKHQKKSQKSQPDLLPVPSVLTVHIGVGVKRNDEV